MASALMNLPMTLSGTPSSGSSASLSSLPVTKKAPVTPGTASSNAATSGGSANSSSSLTSQVPDFYSQALSFLQPTITAQTQPLNAMLGSLPGLYNTEKTGLTNEANAITASGQTEENQVAQQTAQGANQIRQGAISSLGQERANNAAAGFASTSGTEQSQEGNIQNQAALNLYNLDQSAQNEEDSISNMTQEQLAPILNQIALLPQEQAQQALQIGTTIAGILGQGSQSALTYAGQMAQLVLQSTQVGANVANTQAQTQALLGGKTTTTTQSKQGGLGGIIQSILGTPTTTSTTGVSDPLGLGLGGG
jgi:hypothetical protein